VDASKVETNRTRTLGLNLVALGAITFLCLSSFAVLKGPTPLLDFRTAFNSARCLVRQCNPYSPSDLVRMDHEDGGQRPSDSDNDRFVMSRNVYFPTEFIVTVPFALLPFKLAQAFWIGLTAGSLILASFLMWNLACSYAPESAGWLLCLLLATSEQIILYGNPVGLAVSLCVIAVWCFLRERLVEVGVLCLAMSLALKPHDAGMVWFYFLLAGGIYRRRALQSLLVLAALSLPTILWLTRIAPNWMRDMRANWAVFTAHGQAADPGPAAFMNHGTALITDLQSVFSVIRDNPHFYEPATYLICAPVLLTWIVVTVRTRPTPTASLLALAAIAPISMLFTYHRIYDAKLVMLAVPACAMLWAERSRIGQFALVITTAAIALTADLVWSDYLRILASLHILTPVQPSALVSATISFPLPLALLLMGTFYLWVYLRRSVRS
jgi:hypothetical protein